MNDAQTCKSMISFDIGILLAQVATFLIALFIIWKLAWKPFLKLLDLRSEKIEKELKESKEARESAEKFKKEYEEKLKTIEAKADEIIKNATRDAELKRDEILKLAKEEVKMILTKGKQQIEQEKEEMMKGLKAEIGGLAILVAEKILEETVDKKVHQKMLDKFFDELEKHGRYL